MNKHWSSQGFSLIEVLASCLVLSLAAVGITATWRLADYKALLARLDHRADRILREYYELQTFAPASANPFRSNLPGEYAPADPASGFLYHPLRGNNSKSNPQYDDLISYTITYIPGDAPRTAQLTLLYTVPGYGSSASSNFKKVVTLNPLPAPTP
jgi:prepilin-type N-terminal cleavage/methylation domain-containing protein